jgi:dihydroflavonol-4-reductase
VKAFVTGGTGLLGSNLIEQLTAGGHEVVALVRDRAKGELIFGATSVKMVEGDMRDVDGFAGALRGCDVLFHTAAYFREYFQPGDHRTALTAVNVAGTVALLYAAERAGVRRAVHVSSAAVIGHRPGGGEADETVPPDAGVMRNPYLESKVLADRAVLDFGRTHDLPVVIILPTWMFGPNDHAPSTSGRLVRNFLDGQIPFIPPGGGKVVDARDVAHAMINAAERGRAGERYIVGGPYRSIDTILHALEAVTGVAAPTRHIPYAAVLAMAWLSQTVARLRGTPALLTVQGVRVLHHNNPTGSAKAVRELGVTFRRLEETLRDAAAWIRPRSTATKG